VQKVEFKVVIKDVDPIAEAIVRNWDEGMEMQRRVIKALTKEFGQSGFFKKKGSHPFEVEMVKKTTQKPCR
jgi:hypothetical protein